MPLPYENLFRLIEDRKRREARWWGLGRHYEAVMDWAYRNDVGFTLMLLVITFVAVASIVAAKVCP